MSDPDESVASGSPDEASRAVLELLGDEFAQDILAAVSESPKSAKQLSDELEVAQSTVYRRVERLEAHDLLLERTRIKNDGSHHSVYEANFDGINVSLEAGRFRVDVEISETPADRFTKLWADIREA